ncbi:MAG: hypothetical protein ABGY71_06460 [bacterium]|nr:hypothetical protein [Planctomycetota bacterium]HIL52400.1 hypothetical protein [Planctomycetota bacterium]
MQIGNNHPSGPKPNDPKDKSLDLDLTRANREGIEKTSSASQERVRETRTQTAQRQTEAQRGNLSRESVELSSESRRLAAGELPGPRGASESAEAREARIEELTRAHKSGTLNTPLRAQASAASLLGGE